MVEIKSKFKTICKVSRAFGSIYSQEELLDLIVQSAIDTMDGKAACLYLFDLENDDSIPVAQKGLSKNYLHSKRRDAKGAIANVMEKGYISIPDVSALPDIDNPESKKAEGIASILVVPVKVKNNIMGILVLYMAEPTVFNEDTIDFLTALAEQGGMAIERARLIERIKSTTVLFHDLAMKINSSLEIKEILRILSEKLTNALGLKAVSVRLLDDEKEKLQLIASYGLSEKYLKKGPISTDTMLGQALDGKVAVIEDTSTDKRVKYREELIAEGLVSTVIVPIRAKDSVIGVMSLHSGVKRVFSEEEIMLIEALAQQGGLAIQNASLYLMLQQEMKDLQEDIWCHRSWF